MKNKEQIVVTVKHKKLRTVAFVLALIIAVCSFTGGIYAYIHKDPGWYDIKPGKNEEVPFYASDVALTCYFTGKSDEIREANNAVTQIYRDALLRAAKLSDAHTTYLGLANLATVNETPGEWVELPKELFDAVSFAYALTQRNEGYSVLSGGLYEEWQALRYLNDPVPSDPLNDLRESGNLHALARLVNDPDALSLELNDKTNEVRLTKSAAYTALEEKMELSGAALDLGLLREAFLVAYAADAMYSTGYDTGVFTTTCGLTYTMSGNSAGSIDLFTLANGEIRQAGEAPFTGNGAAVAICRAFALPEELGYYTVETADKTVFRSPFYSALTGEPADLLLTACAARSDCTGDAIMETVYDALILFFGGEPGASSKSACYAVAADVPEALRAYQ